MNTKSLRCRVRCRHRYTLRNRSETAMRKTPFTFAAAMSFAAAPVAAQMSAPAVAQPRLDIVETAVAAGSFNTLATALRAAGLVETLKGKGPFTVFAPTDAAFAKLPAGTVDGLLKPENKAKLTQILTYH